VDGAEDLGMQGFELAHAFKRIVQLLLGHEAGVERHGHAADGEVLGRGLDPGVQRGLEGVQWGQLYQKNSITSTLPAGASGATGLSSRLKSLPSLNWRACAMAGLATGSVRAEAATAEAADKENSRRFMTKTLLVQVCGM